MTGGDFTHTVEHTGLTIPPESTPFATGPWRNRQSTWCLPPVVPYEGVKNCSLLVALKSTEQYIIIPPKKAEERIQGLRHSKN